MSEQDESPVEVTSARGWMLAAFALSTILLIPFHEVVPQSAHLAVHLAGGFVWAAAVILVLRDPEAKVRRRMGVLLGCTMILAICNINTNLDNANFLQVGIPFTLVVLLPALIFGKTDPGVIRYRFWPRKPIKVDVAYTLLSIPLAWAVLQFYSWGNLTLLNDELYSHWNLPPGDPDSGQIQRLFIGINMVGIWDELFFVNTVFAVLRSMFRFRLANALQAVVYTSVLFDMAFSGLGVFIVYFFAWTQGSMYERSENLLWVLIVHLIVDFFLVAAIVNFHYPDAGLGFGFLIRHGV